MAKRFLWKERMNLGPKFEGKIQGRATRPKLAVFTWSNGEWALTSEGFLLSRKSVDSEAGFGCATFEERAAKKEVREGGGRR